MTWKKANLLVILKVDDVIAAEIEDPLLWQQVLTAIQRRDLQQPNGDRPNLDSTVDTSLVQGLGPVASNSGGDSVDALAGQLKVARAQLEGACSPMMDAPFLHLDMHCWEEMRRQVPLRGRTAIPPAVAAGTLLLLWLKRIDISTATQSQVQAVLSTITERDKNPSRSLKNASWIQVRPGHIALNPAEISKAITLASCFCSKDWKTWNDPRA